MTDDEDLDLEGHEAGDEPEPGWHVIHDGVSLGCYDSEAEAEAFADGHPRNNGLDVTVEEVKG